MSNISNCAECGKSLTAHSIKHGWKTFEIGYSSGSARVHTICLAKFGMRTTEDQLQKRSEVA